MTAASLWRCNGKKAGYDVEWRKIDKKRLETAQGWAGKWLKRL